MADATTIAPGFREQVKQTGGHMADAGQSLYGAAKSGVSRANELARSGVEQSIASIKANGFWNSLAHGARRQPLIAGAAVVTAGVVATKAVASPRRQELYQRSAGASLGR